MIGKILGAAIGSRIDRSDGEGGLKGAAIGVVVASALRRLAPLGLALGGAYVLKKSMDRRRAR
jgi:hypothetical protein